MSNQDFVSFVAINFSFEVKLGLSSSSATKDIEHEEISLNIDIT